MRNSKFLLPAAFLFFFSTLAHAQLRRNDSERQLFEALNRERTAQGLSALHWDNALFKAARQHALRMANLNRLEHQLPSESNLEGRLGEAGARFGAIAENIAIGPNPSIIHAGWMDSSGHRKNILDPQLTSVGIAAVRGQGGLFAVQDFSQFVPDLSVERQEQKVVSLLTAQGFRPANATAGARKTCETDAGFGGTSARAMIRFEATDLEKLPEVLERKIRSEPYGKAAVGACRANGTSGFARYRVAVLFF
ncbi:MAG TPA: CAP domain-containing protein [Candidatus Limnocylindria bacterium]|nr:CAP domain-containing protein [Candidatus Limnocylindria bacterium]